MKPFFLVLTFTLLSSFQLLSQESSVKIKLNDEQRFRFESDRFEFVNPQHNVLLGDSCGFNINGNMAAMRNVFIGYRAGYSNETGEDNVFIGDSSGYYNIGGNYNTAVGPWSGWLNDEGLENAFFGAASGAYNTTGIRNSCYGTVSGYRNDTGSYNCFFGYAAGAMNHGSFNVFVGRSAGHLNEGDSSVFLGYRAGMYDTTSNKLYIANSETMNPLIYGEFDNHTLRFNASRIGIRNPGENTFIGDSAGAMNNGIRNVFVGHRAGYSNSDGQNNIFIGDSAGYKSTSTINNLFIGNWAGWSNVTGSSNVFMGHGSGAGNLDGYLNVMIGVTSGLNNTSGKENTFLGTSAGGQNTSGSYNTYLGRRAGLNNMTGDSNVCIGYYAGAQETGSNKLYIDNSDTTQPLLYGEFDNELFRVNGTLDIKGNYHFPLTDGASGQFLQTNGSGILSWADAISDFSNGGEAGGANRSLGNTDNYALSLITNDLERLHITNGGNIGIGTTAPGTTLEVIGDTWVEGNLAVGNDSVDRQIAFNGTIGDGVLKMYSYGDFALGSDAGVNVRISSGNNFTVQTYDGSFHDRFKIFNNGNVAFGNITPTALLDINGTTGYNQLRMRTSFTPTDSSDSHGNTGDIAWDDDFIYIKTSSGWKRAALSSW